MKKRIFKLIALTLALVLLMAPAFAGCTSSGGDNGGSSGGKKATLQFIGGPWKEYAAQVERLLATYKEVAPNITIEFTADGDTLQPMIASGNYPEIITSVAYSTLASYKEYLRDLTNEALWSEVEESSYSSVTFDGKRIMVPLNYESYGLIYNKNYLADAGFSEPPKTFDEFKTLCENLEANGITPLGFGFKEGWILDQFLVFTFHDDQMGLTEITEKLVSGEVAIEDTFFYSNYKEFFDYCLAHCQDKVLESDYTSQVTLFAAGEVAMISNGDWIAEMVTEIDPDIDMGLMGIPFTNDSNQYYIYNNISNAIGTFKDAKNTDAALDFISWLVTSEAGKNWIGQDWCYSTPVKGVDANINPLSKDGMAASAGGYALEWGNNYFPSNLGDIFTVGGQKYILGEITWEDYCKSISEAFVNSANAEAAE